MNIGRHTDTYVFCCGAKVLEYTTSFLRCQVNSACLANLFKGVCAIKATTDLKSILLVPQIISLIIF